MQTPCIPLLFRKPLILFGKLFMCSANYKTECRLFLTMAFNSSTAGNLCDNKPEIALFLPKKMGNYRSFVACWATLSSKQNL